MPIQLNRLLAANSLICIKKRLIGKDPLLRPDQLAWLGNFAHTFGSQFLSNEGWEDVSQVFGLYSCHRDTRGGRSC
jgi:hypothetical protein